MFIDEGAGKYNPAPQVLDEAAVNEWPGREVGVFVSIGTGKRPPGTGEQQHLWWEGFVSGGMGDFAEARRRLIAKIEGCEETHQYMVKEHLSKRGVNPENYYRLNVEVGVGEFGMNEWNRLADISTNTHRYLGKSEVQWYNASAATKMAKIHNAHVRLTRHISGMEFEPGDDDLLSLEVAHPLAVELPGSEIDPSWLLEHPPSRHQQQQQQQQLGLPGQSQQAIYVRPGSNLTMTPPPSYHQFPFSQDKFSVLSSESEAPQVVDSSTTTTATSPQPPPVPPPPPRPSIDLSPSSGIGGGGPGRRSNEYASPARSSVGSFIPSPRRSSEYPDQARPISAAAPSIVPPLPPKTPLPYPDHDDPPNPKYTINNHTTALHSNYDDRIVNDTISGSLDPRRRQQSHPSYNPHGVGKEGGPRHPLNYHLGSMAA